MLKIVFIIIGTFIGAGFASGKEIHLFFYQYGFWGIPGIIISTTFIGFLVFKTLKILKSNYIENYDDFINYVIKNKIIKKILRNIISIFLVISFCIMVSGFCEFLNQEFNVNKIFSHLFILIFCFIIFRKNLDGITKLNNFFIPIAIIIILYIAIAKVDSSCIYLLKNNVISEINLQFIFKAIIYANYNLLSIIPIIVGIKKLINKKGNIKIISCVVSIIIFVLSFVIFSILAQTKTQNNSDILKLEMPVIFIIGEYGRIYKLIYSAIIGIAIITTAASSGYSYLQKFEGDRGLYYKSMIYLMLGTIVSVQIGFSRLIQVLYPVFGIIGIVQSFFIVIF